MSERPRKWVPRTIGLLAVLGLLTAAYYFSACVMLENDCHLGHEGGCEALARTLRFSALLAVASLAAVVAAIFMACRRRRAA
jgi:hypothetical protein